MAYSTTVGTREVTADYCSHCYYQSGQSRGIASLFSLLLLGDSLLLIRYLFTVVIGYGSSQDPDQDQVAERDRTLMDGRTLGHV